MGSERDEPEESAGRRGRLRLRRPVWLGAASAAVAGGAVAALFAAAAPSLEPGVSSVPSDDVEARAAAPRGEGSDECSLLVTMLKPEHSLRPAVRVLNNRYKPLDVSGKSWYFVLVDRFALSPGENASSNDCMGELTNWCNGTLKGITSKLGYIQEMGFDCIWITPVIYQFQGDDGPSGRGYYGYWAYRWFEIDPHYGTEQDFKDLSSALHKRGMCLVYDIVLNHVGPIHGEADVAKVDPFNKTAYYDTLNIGNMSFDEYTRLLSGWPPPAQAIGPGAMCIGPSCNNYQCMKTLPPSGEAAGEPENCTYLGPMAAGPKELRYCGVGDLACPGYNETIVTLGWFYDLGKLNQSVPFVNDKLKEWLRYMLETYDIDGLRLDTAPYVGKPHLTGYQAVAGVPMFGEVTTTNISYHASFQDGVLDALLNFPAFNVVGPGYCGGPFWPYSVFNLTSLGHTMQVQQTPGVYKNPDLLGNFIDNHDAGRVSEYCRDDSRFMNALVWVMFARGVPIIFYGTEDKFLETKEPMWKHGYHTNGKYYEAIKRMNAIRKEQQLGFSSMDIVHASESMLVFTRGGGGTEGTWIFTNNFRLTDKEVEYPVLLPDLPDGQIWMNVLKQPSEVAVLRSGSFVANGSMPQVLVAVGNSSAKLKLVE